MSSDNSRTVPYATSMWVYLQKVEILKWEVELVVQSLSQYFLQFPFYRVVWNTFQVWHGLIDMVLSDNIFQINSSARLCYQVQFKGRHEIQYCIACFDITKFKELMTSMGQLSDLGFMISAKKCALSSLPHRLFLQLEYVENTKEETAAGNAYGGKVTIPYRPPFWKPRNSLVSALETPLQPK